MNKLEILRRVKKLQKEKAEEIRQFVNVCEEWIPTNEDNIEVAEKGFDFFFKNQRGLPACIASEFPVVGNGWRDNFSFNLIWLHEEFAVVSKGQRILPLKEFIASEKKVRKYQKEIEQFGKKVDFYCSVLECTKTGNGYLFQVADNLSIDLTSINDIVASGHKGGKRVILFNKGKKLYVEFESNIIQFSKW